MDKSDIQLNQLLDTIKVAPASDKLLSAILEKTKTKPQKTNFFDKIASYFDFTLQFNPILVNATSFAMVLILGFMISYFSSNVSKQNTYQDELEISYVVWGDIDK